MLFFIGFYGFFGHVQLVFNIVFFCILGDKIDDGSSGRNKDKVSDQRSKDDSGIETSILEASGVANYHR